MVNIRINKYLAQAGVASRRKIDLLISEKKVVINNLVANLGDKVDPDIDKIMVEGKHIYPQVGKKQYYAFHKPDNCVSTVYEQFGRESVMDYFPKAVGVRLYPVGRLDYHTTGLMIITNDGDITQKITHPSFHLPKTYKVGLTRKPSTSDLDTLKKGFKLDDGFAKATNISLASISGKYYLTLTIYEGRNHLVRRMMAELNLNMFGLKRISIGNLKLGNLLPGQYRSLTQTEIEYLKSD